MQDLKHHKELGKVNWGRDYDAALAESKATQKPILLLFQEVPGCITCVNFGLDSLSFPLMVEAIENEFVPLFIYNNKKGKDEIILKKYNEPSWNNPVVYFLDENGESIVPRLANNYTPIGLYNKMIETLEIKERSKPAYLSMLEKDIIIMYGPNSTIYYETPCFWSGETSMIQHPAVLSTEAGWIDGREVVKVVYDTENTKLKELDEYALDQGFFKIEFKHNYKIDKAPQYYLKNSIYSGLPLSLAQRSLLNQILPYKTKDPKLVLSPLQKRWVEQLSGKGDIKPLYNLDFEASWEFAKEKEKQTLTSENHTL